MYNISEFAKLVCCTVKHIQKLDREGIFKSSGRTVTNRRYYTQEDVFRFLNISADVKESKIVSYCRVSNKSQDDDLKNQIKYVQEYCNTNNISIQDEYIDIGSGLNFKRKQFLKLMDDVELGLISKIIISYKDRLVRFGFDFFERFCRRHGCEIIIINNVETSPEQEMIKDLISIIHVFSCRIYGLRKYKKDLKNETK
jgi:predicted site-specific integrase-resolvase